MSDKQIHDKFLHLFQGFIKDLTIALPDYSEQLTNDYSSLLEKTSITNIQKSKQLLNFSNCIYQYNTYITNRDRRFFDEDPKLLQNISIKQLWNSDITPKNRNTIWKYLQSFCIISMNIQSSKNLKKLLQGDDQGNESVDKQDLKSLKKLHKLTETVQSSEPEPESDSTGLEGLLESSSIGKLAKDIASNLDLGDLGSQIKDGESMDIGKIMQSTDFMGIFQKINEQVQEKFTNGEIDDSLLSGEAEQMLPNMMNNPFFQNMMNSDLFKNLQNEQQK